MFCPVRGWCEVFLFDYETKKGFIDNYCNGDLDLYKMCLTFNISCYVIKKAIPQGCLCRKNCCNIDCFKQPISVAKERFLGTYKNCVCGDCDFEKLCFPTMLVDGEEDEYIQSLSNKVFQRLLIGLNPFLKQTVFESRITESVINMVKAIERRMY